MVEEYSARLGGSSGSLDAVFRALGDPTRRAMLKSLAQGEVSVCELAAPFRMSLAGASKHIKILERAGLVKRTIVGRTHRCRADPGPLSAAENWLETYRSFWNGRLDALAAALEQADRPHSRERSTR
jgi:DNA-binding transcriptional ArsR family regulator